MARKKTPKMPRIEPVKRPTEERINDFLEIYETYSPAMAKTEAGRCIACKKPRCEEACPLTNHIRDWLILVAEDRLDEAADLAQQTNPMTEICGRICPQDRLCEGACVVGIKHEPVAIGAVERFLGEYAFTNQRLPSLTTPLTGRRVAVVGGGPAGLACAYGVRRRGHEVTVFEASAQPGGLLLYGIPGFKLNKNIVLRRIFYLESLGIRFVNNTRIGEGLTLQGLFEQGYEAVFVGTGATRAKAVDLEGIDLLGVEEGLPFLIRNNPKPQQNGIKVPDADDLHGQKICVLGGGDTAMDCVRTALRCGAAEAVCVYRRDEANMPGSRREVQNAKDEGGQFFFLVQPVRFIGDGTGRVQAIECIRTELGEPDEGGRRRPVPIPDSLFQIPTERVILAFGFDGSPLSGPDAGRLTCSRWGTYTVDENKMTSWPGVFAGGDNVRGADLLVTALRDGLDAAAAIDQYLNTKTSTVPEERSTSMP